jgi:hypothetical protein
LSDADIEANVLEFRRARAAWQDGIKMGKKASEPKAKVSLADLGLL